MAETRSERVVVVAGGEGDAWADALRARGYAVERAGDVTAALAAARDAAAAVVSATLPQGGGFAACAALRHDPAVRVPIVLAGADRESARRHARVASRADAYAFAPSDGAAIADVVAEAIRRGPAPSLGGRRARIGRAVAAVGVIVVVGSLALALGDDLRVWTGGVPGGRGWWRFALGGLVLSDLGRRVARGLPARPGLAGWIALALLVASALVVPSR